MATYHPIPSSGTLSLRRRSSCSFDCSDIPALVAWLAEHGYRPIGIRSQYEYSRMRRGHELIVLYQSGSIVCQGDGAATAIKLLNELEHTTPQAQATLKRGRECWLWIVHVCPLCGKKHTHGGRPIEGDPRTYLGHRVAHCLDRSGGYELVEEGEL